MIERMRSKTRRHRLVGRTREVDLLRQELGRATAGEFCCLVIGGQPGVGKSRLASELVARAGGAAIVLSARGHALGETASFGLWAEAFESHLRGLAPGEVAACAGGFVDDLAALLHSVAAAGKVAPNRDPPRARLLEGMAALLANLAERQRVVVVLDDLHWADSSSFVALRYFAHNLSSSRVLVLATVRRYELAAEMFGSEVLLGLEQDGFARRLDLAPIGSAEIAELAGSVLRRPPPPALTSWLAERSGGNPLFAHGLLRALLEEGADLSAPRLQRLPEDLTARVNTWVAGLDEASRSLLELLAVVGRRLGPEELISLTERPIDELGALLAGLSRRGLVNEDDRSPSLTYEITHPLLTEVIYRELGGVRRRTLHRLVARCLFNGGAPGDAAPHYARCAEVGEIEAVGALVAAIRQAELRQAHHELFVVLKALVELLPAGDERWLAVFDVMDSDAIRIFEQRTDRTDIDAKVGVQAMRSINAVLAPGDFARRGAAKLRLANFAGWGIGDIDEAESACHEAVELFHQAGELERALVATCQLSWLRGIGGDSTGWVATSRLAVDGAVAAGFDDVLLHGLTSLGMGLSFAGSFAEAEVVLRQAVKLAAADGKHASREAWSRGALAMALAVQGRTAEAEQELITARGAVPRSRGTTLDQFGVALAWCAGNYPLAVERARPTMARHAVVVGRRQALGPGFAAVAAAELGHCTEARALVAQAVAASGTRDWLSFGHVARWAGAVVDWRTGRDDEALAVLRTVREDIVAGGYRWLALFVLPDVIELAMQCGQAQTAASAARELVTVAPTTDGAASRGFAALGKAYAGLAAQQPDPLAAQEAVEQFSATGFQGFHGRALAALGRSLPGRAGCPALQEAISVFVAMGAVWRRDQTLTDLRALGSAGRKAARAAMPGGLTRREREVALLAARGESARAMAAHLGIGQRTVDYHLANIYAKLGVRSKLELAARADELGFRVG